MSPKDCLLIGSVPLENNEAVFRLCSKELPGILPRIPDGETGERHYFTKFQASKFPKIMLSDFVDNGKPTQKTFTARQIADGLQELSQMNLETGYDTAAIESYRTFKSLKERGVIEQEVKFQVSLPTVSNVVGVFIELAFQQEVEPIYEAALFRALHAIQNEIPRDELAIQIDLGMDLAYWEGVFLEPWFSDKKYVVDYIARMIQEVHYDVDLGIHYCYGDMDHKHYVEPTSLGAIVDLHSQIAERNLRRIDWMHCPVPVTAMDILTDYFAPLRGLTPTLAQNETKLYLGLVHPRDLSGTWERIREAEKVIREFGISTECGWGRTPLEDVSSILEILKEVASN